jgi:hypothetical protein
MQRKLHGPLRISDLELRTEKLKSCEIIMMEMKANYNEMIIKENVQWLLLYFILFYTNGNWS